MTLYGRMIGEWSVSSSCEQVEALSWNSPGVTEQNNK